MTLLTVLTSFRTNNLKGLGATLTVEALILYSPLAKLAADWDRYACAVGPRIEVP